MFSVGEGMASTPKYPALERGNTNASLLRDLTLSSTAGSSFQSESLLPLKKRCTLNTNSSESQDEPLDMTTLKKSDQTSESMKSSFSTSRSMNSSDYITNGESTYDKSGFTSFSQHSTTTDESLPSGLLTPSQPDVIVDSNYGASTEPSASEESYIDDPIFGLEETATGASKLYEEDESINNGEETNAESKEGQEEDNKKGGKGEKEGEGQERKAERQKAAHNIATSGEQRAKSHAPRLALSDDDPNPEIVCDTSPTTMQLMDAQSTIDSFQKLAQKIQQNPQLYKKRKLDEELQSAAKRVALGVKDLYMPNLPKPAGPSHPRPSAPATAAAAGSNNPHETPTSIIPNPDAKRRLFSSAYDMSVAVGEGHYGAKYLFFTIHWSLGKKHTFNFTYNRQNIETLIEHLKYMDKQFRKGDRSFLGKPKRIHKTTVYAYEQDADNNMFKKATIMLMLTSGEGPNPKFKWSIRMCACKELIRLIEEVVGGHENRLHLASEVQKQ